MREKLLSFSREDFIEFLNNITPQIAKTLAKEARDLANDNFQNKVYARGLIEFTSFCKNNCYYCGIRLDNKNASRYRLSKDDILKCCETGYEIGFRTFVLQGGEDPWFTDERMTDIISSIRVKYPDCAITLSLGERSAETYERFFTAGADRYLLRHETANAEHYGKLHPKELTFSNRRKCLFALKKIGYQVGAGFMVGSPYQTNETLADDLLFLIELQPEMIGIGPFIPQDDSPFRNEPAGSVEKTLILLSIVRILLPRSLIPATTALGTLDNMGREKALKSGANVLMPNLSPADVRRKYLLYNDKICTDEEAAESFIALSNRISLAGFEMVFDRGDHPDWIRKSKT